MEFAPCRSHSAGLVVLRERLQEILRFADVQRNVLVFSRVITGPLARTGA